MKTETSVLACLLALAQAAFGSVTLDFNNGSTGISSNLANAGGVVSDNLIYGIIVDGNGDGIANLQSFPLNMASLTVSSVHVLSTFGGLADDVLFTGDFRTGDTSIYDGGSQTGGPGGLFTVPNIVFQGHVGTGDSFLVVWFDGIAGRGGILSDLSFTLPSDGLSVNKTAPFAGTDPVRVAGLAYSGTSGVSVGPGIIPEPSSALLAVAGALGFLRRRRA